MKGFIKLTESSGHILTVNINFICSYGTQNSETSVLVEKAILVCKETISEIDALIAAAQK
jgi:hypothetical protein